MSSSIQNQVTQMQSHTNIMKGEERVKNGASQELGQDAFLMLMMEQLKYQDPLAPVGNTEFLAQQAAFTQVSELQKLNGAISVNNQVTQACSLMGQHVTLTDPNNPKKTISGEVSAVTFSGGNAQLVIGDKEYPLSLMIAVEPASGSNNAGSTESTNNTENNT